MATTTTNRTFFNWKLIGKLGVLAGVIGIAATAGMLGPSQELAEKPVVRAATMETAIPPGSAVADELAPVAHPTVSTAPAAPALVCAANGAEWQKRMKASEVHYPSMRSRYEASTDLQKDNILAGLKGKHIVDAGVVDEVEKSWGEYLIRVNTDQRGLFDGWDVSLEGHFDPAELATIIKGTPIRFEGDVSRAAGVLGQPLLTVNVACFEVKHRSAAR